MYHGYGVQTHQDGRQYEGHWLNHEKHGFGCAIFDHGDKYEGYWNRGKIHGWGKYTQRKNNLILKGYHFNNCMISGIRISGDVISLQSRLFNIVHCFYIDKNNKKLFPQNEWRLTCSSNALLDQNIKLYGLFIDTELELGIMDWNHGTKYEGQLNINKAQAGFGKLIQANGTVYEGNWRNGEICGYGRAVFIDGSIYEGNWKADQPEGQGTYVWFMEGESYKNQLFKGLIRSPMPIMGDTFRDELYSTIVIAQTKDIQVKYQYQYIGSWYKGKFNGQGKLFTKGAQYIGEFKDHLLQGKGTLKTSEKIYIGEWSNGKFTRLSNQQQNMIVRKAQNQLINSLIRFNSLINQAQFLHSEQGQLKWLFPGDLYKQHLFQGLIRYPLNLFTSNNTTFEDEFYIDRDNYEEALNPKVIPIIQQYRYKGQWQYGEFNGVGELSTQGISYKGQFKNHLMHGKGIMTIGDAIYPGYWENGTKMGDQIPIKDLLQIQDNLPLIELE